MSSLNYRYYLAKGRDEQTVREFFRSRDEAFAQARAIAEKHGGEAVTRGRTMCGVVFNGEVPDGWKREGSTGDSRAYYMPLRRSKAGKEIAKEIGSVSIPGAIDLHSKLSPNEGSVFGDAGPNGGFFILYITAEIVGGQCIIHVPRKMDFRPPHSQPLKQSEYWQIKEAALAKATA
jgi:hypothetical protein